MRKPEKPTPKPPPQLTSIPDLEPDPRQAQAAPPTVHAAFANYPADMQAVAMQAYDSAKSSGMKEGDSVAAAKRAVRNWAREHDRRFPD